MGREVPVPERHDPTVCNPTDQKLIEEYYGFSTKDTDPEALRFIVERCKEAGNAAFKQKDYKGKTLLSLVARPASKRHFAAPPTACPYHVIDLAGSGTAAEDLDLLPLVLWLQRP